VVRVLDGVWTCLSVSVGHSRVSVCTKFVLNVADFVNYLLCVAVVNCVCVVVLYRLCLLLAGFDVLVYDL